MFLLLKLCAICSADYHKSQYLGSLQVFLFFYEVRKILGGQNFDDVLGA